MGTGVGDEGGFAPRVKSNAEAMELLLEAITKAVTRRGSDCLGLGRRVQRVL